LEDIMKNLVLALVVSFGLAACDGAGLSGAGSVDAGAEAQVGVDAGAEAPNFGPIPDCAYQFRPQHKADGSGWECVPMPVCPWGWGDYPQADWSGWYCKCVQDCP
jgi:hypothetical protein